MKRLFTFGCSFTRYWRWPTWADILARQYDFFENWGVCGGGNDLIVNSLVECHATNKLTTGDHVVVMWTSTSREDQYVGTRWKALGNIYWSAGTDYPLDYVKRFACERGYLIRDLANVTMAKQFLNSLGVTWQFLSMVPLDQSNFDSELGNDLFDSKKENLDVIELYRPALSDVRTSMYEAVFNQNWNSRPGIADSRNPKHRDFHPTPMEHVEYLQKVLPEYPIPEADQIWAQDVQSQIQRNQLTWSPQETLPRRL